MDPRRTVLSWRSLATVLIAGLALACIRAPVAVEIETTGADLSAIQTFALADPPWPHPRVGARIEDEIRSVLKKKGLIEAPLERAEIAVGYRAVGRGKTRTVPIADPDANYRVRQEYIEKTVEIDVFDARSREVLWRGIGQIDVVSEPAQPAAAAKAVRRILKEFPPES